MRIIDRFDGLSVFLAVAQRGGFRAAAAELGVTPGAISQAVQTLERRLGQPLFQRTTRSVALTEAGQALLARAAPASAAISEALSAIESMTDQPRGLLRLTVPRLAVPLFITPALALLQRAHPQVAVEVSVDNAFVDLGTGRFDAGIRVGEAVGKNMKAMRLSPNLRWCVVGAPSYFEKYGHPRTPQELARHRTVGYRLAGKDAIYRWEMEHAGRALTVDVGAGITVNDGALGLELARMGLGLVYTADIYILDDLAKGILQTTLNDYATESSGFFIYFAAGAQKQPKMRALLDILKTISASGRAAAGSKKLSVATTSAL